MRLILILLLSFVGLDLAHADPAIARGKTKAAACIACHGPGGISLNPLWPNLAGQKKEYLLKQMRDFRDGRRKDPLMTPMALTQSDSDFQDLAAYFSSL